MLAIIELNPMLLFCIAIIPTIFLFLIFKFREKKHQEHFKALEKDTLHLNSNILDLEGEIVVLKKELENYKHSAGIVRMEEKPKAKGVI
jgi:hypothetical protein